MRWKKILIVTLLLANLASSVTAECQDPSKNDHFISVHNLNGEFISDYQLTEIEYFDNTGWCTISNFIAPKSDNSFYLNDGGFKAMNINNEGNIELSEDIGKLQSNLDNISIISTIFDDYVVFSDMEMGAHAYWETTYNFHIQDMDNNDMDTISIDIASELAQHTNETTKIWDNYYHASSKLALFSFGIEKPETQKMEYFLLRYDFSSNNLTSIITSKYEIDPSEMAFVESNDKILARSFDENDEPVIIAFEFTSGTIAEVSKDIPEGLTIGNNFVYDNDLYFVDFADDGDELYKINLENGEFSMISEIENVQDRIYIINDYIIATYDHSNLAKLLPIPMPAIIFGIFVGYASTVIWRKKRI